MMLKLDKTVIAGCALAAAASFGCRNHENRTAASSPVTRAGEPTAAAGSRSNNRASEKPAITLTGCLQRMNGTRERPFILTQANLAGTNAPIATSGTVAQKETNQAEHSYRLEGDTNRLRRNVGHRVRVDGKLEDRGDVVRKETAADSANDRHSSQREVKIKPSDLPKIEVVAVTNVADTCGARKPHSQRNGTGRKAL
jgi:hypothetical protein